MTIPTDNELGFPTVGVYSQAMHHFRRPRTTRHSRNVNAAMNSAETLRDPLSILGHDIFVDIVSWLCSVDDLVAVESVSRSWRETATAHSSWLWRFAAIDMGLDECNIKAGDYLAETGEWAVDPNDHRLVVLDPARLLYPNVDHGWLSARSSRRPTPMGTPGVESTRVNWRAMCTLCSLTH